MSSILRPSSRQVSYIALSTSRSTVRLCARGARIPRISSAATPSSSSSFPSAYLLPRPRFYATESNRPKKQDKNDQKTPQNGAKPKNSENSSADSPVEGGVKSTHEDPPSKEQVDKRASSNSEPRQPAPGNVFLSDKELAALEKMRVMVPKRQQEAIDQVMKEVKENGAPPELQELLHKSATTGLSLGDSMQIVRVTHKMAALLAEKEAQQMSSNDSNNKMFDSQEPRIENKEESKSKDSEQEGKQQGPKQDSGKKDPNIKVFDTGDILSWILAAAVIYPLWGMFFPSESREISWQELKTQYLEKGLVEKFVVVGRRVRVYLNHDAVRSVDPGSPAANPGFHFYVNIGSSDMFERHLDEAQAQLGIPPSEFIPVTYAAESQLGNLIMAFGPTLLLVGLIYYASRRGPGGGGPGGGMFGFSKSKAKMYNHESAVKVKFADIAGMDEAKVEIMEFVAFLKQPERFQRLGAKIPRGAILSGPPGTGKTLLAKATAGESGVPFFSVSGSEFVEMFVGVGASRVRDLFAQARKNAPCIIFIDEIDAIGRSRADGNRNFGGNEEREATLNQILTEMDGFNTQEQIVVLAGTNRPDVLDQALMRPGRFDRQIHIDRPTMQGRADIFKVHLAKIVTKEDIEHLCGRLAALTPGFSGADIANAVNEAALVGQYHLSLSIDLFHLCNQEQRKVTNQYDSCTSQCRDCRDDTLRTGY